MLKQNTKFCLNDYAKSNSKSSVALIADNNGTHLQTQTNRRDVDARSTEFALACVSEYYVMRK